MKKYCTNCGYVEAQTTEDCIKCGNKLVSEIRDTYHIQTAIDTAREENPELDFTSSEDIAEILSIINNEGQSTLCFDGTISLTGSYDGRGYGVCVTYFSDKLKRRITLFNDDMPRFFNATPDAALITWVRILEAEAITIEASLTVKN